MRIHFCTVFLSGLLLAAPLLRAQEIQILMGGGEGYAFHIGESPAQSGETWYGLFADSGKVFLKRTTITVEPFQDKFAGDKEGEKSARRVSCDRSGQPLFLVRGIAGLEEREVKTQFQGKKFFFPGQTMTMDAITLAAFGNYQKNEPFAPCLQIYSIEYSIIDHWNEYHLIAAYKALPVEEELPNLIWAGDLDNDGWVDMFWDLSGKYSYHMFTLFLSSRAAVEYGVGKAAELRIQLDT